VRALISVWDKAGIAEFAVGLAELGFELVSSGGTASFLEEQGLAVTRVEDVTGAPEMLGGRVKTLHPRIHAGILARRDLEEDRETLAEHEIEPFDLVCVNLYPFASVAARRGTTEAEAVEMIDVGGPSLLRAAAKNFVHVAPVSSPTQYEAVLTELRSWGELRLETRRELAMTAFAATAAYDASISSWFSEVDRFPDRLTLTFEKVNELRYGENPHQRGAYYSDAGARRHLLSNVDQLHGKELSLVNLLDLSAGVLLAREFTVPTCVIVKHANPCGVAMGATIEEAYELAMAADPVSPFGMVCVLNRPVSARLGAALAERFVDVLIARGYEDEALVALKSKPNTRILLDRERRAPTPGERDLKRVLGGILIQDRDLEVDDRERMQVVAGEVTEEQWGDLLFAWRVCKHVWSNAIVIAKGLQTIGIGGGQTSRVDAVRIAVEKAKLYGHDLTGAALASDALFPFADGPQLALEAGVSAVIQPGGAIRDDEVIAAVGAAGAAMVFTGRRHFRH
jgi:phosphoribosylaminoimidazolecarboxamide formyltransferase/IMP cyclohydrolase